MLKILQAGGAKCNDALSQKTLELKMESEIKKGGGMGDLIPYRRRPRHENRRGCKNRSPGMR